jgi:hypothetical protein
MNTEKIEKLKKSLSNNLLPADLKPKIEAEIKRLEDLDSKQPTKRGAKKTSNAKQSKTTKPKRTAMSLAKEIRKEGESWNDARARASKMMKEKSHTATKDVETELSKLAEGGYLTDPTFGNFQNQVFAKGGEIQFQHSNIRIVGTGMDTNGNRVVKVSFPNQRPFSIQTNGNLPKTHNLLKGYDKNTNFSVKEIESMEDEILDYVENYGSANQKKSLKVYGSYLDKNNFANGGGVDYGGGLLLIYKESDGKYKWKFTFKNGKIEKSFDSFNTFVDAKRDFDYRSKYMKMANGGFMNDVYAKGGSVEKKYNSMPKEDKEELMETQIGVGRMPFNQYEKYSQLTEHHKKLVNLHFARQSKTLDNGGNINNITKKMRKQKLKKGDTVTIYGKRWFDRINGNTYHTAEVEVNGTTLGKSPMTYGYDEQYLQTGKEILLKHYDLPRGMTERSPMWQLRDYGVTLTKYVSDGLKRELAKGGGVTFKNGREYPTGRNWTNDHRHINKSDDHEVKYTRKKKFELGGTVVTDLAGHTGGGNMGTTAGMPLSGVSGTNYTGLVGETGAMSSGEMFMAGGTLPLGSEQSYMITEALGNPAQHYAKGGGVTFKNGREYPIGRNWTNDHRHINKSDEHEVKYTRKKLMAGGTFAGGGGVNDINYDDVLEVLKDKLEESTEELPRGFDNYDNFTAEEVEKESRDGFIAYTDGGYEVTWFESMSYFNSTGYSLPTKPLDTEMQRQLDYNYQLAKERFIEDYPEIVEELGEDNIDYNSLYEAGYEDEAEQLSEWEMDFDGEDSIMCQIGAYYYNTENYRGIDEKHTIRLFGLVNLESPYHRRGNLDDSYDIDITFDSISELKEKVDAGLKEIIDWFGGKNYNDSTTEMKIRRMDDGGNVGRTPKRIKQRLEELRKEIRNENISYGEIVELQSMKQYIDPNDVELLEFAGVPEFEDDEENYADGGMTNLTIQDVSFAKGGGVSQFKNIMETNTITEKEINLIKNRMNNDKVDEATQQVIDYIWDNSPQLTPDQNKKGIDFLRNLWKSPTGKERTNNPFGYREQDTLETFEYFELRGFYDAGNRYRKFYVPLYTCVGANSNFEYAFYNGQVNILG